MRRPDRPLRIAGAVGAAVGLGLTGLAAVPASATALHVQALIDAAPSGGTVHLPAGTFAGGLTIAKSLTLVGAGAGKTVLKGGNSVVTVTSPGSVHPTVALADLSLTGGAARGSADDRYEAYGGGLLVEPAGGHAGASVTLRGVVVSGNRALPTSTSASPSGVQCPGGVDCPYAKAAGGGIASFGNLVLDHTMVRGNTAGGRVSDSDGGGVYAELGTLSVTSSVIAGNLVTSTGIGRFAEGGGVFAEGPTVGIRTSRISGNSAVLRSDYPSFASKDADGPIDMNANSGGVHLGDDLSAVVDRSTISGNRVVADDTNGEPYAFSSGLFVGESTADVRRTTVRDNTVTARVRTSADVGYSGNALEIDGGGSLTDSSISGNRADVFSPTGDAQASDGLGVFTFDGPARRVVATRLVISGNSATARSPKGSAEVFGAGVLNDGLLALDHSTVRSNRGVAAAPSATAQGGGIYNGALVGIPPVTLHLLASSVTGNSVSAKGGAARGGGIYEARGNGVTSSLRSTSVHGNLPDQVSAGTAS